MLEQALQKEIAQPTDVARRLGDVVAGGLVSVEQVAEPTLLDMLQQIPGAVVGTNPESTVTEVLGGKAMLLTDVNLGGLVHISKDVIRQFTPDKSGKNGGKFGAGTYFALGDLGGETADDLVRYYDAGSLNRHETSITGNFLIIKAQDARAVYYDTKGISEGRPQDMLLRTTTGSARILAHLQQLTSNGQPIDGLIGIMDQDEPCAEVAIVPASTPKIVVEGIYNKAMV